MDAVSDVLSLVRLGGAVFLNGEFREPWCLTSEVDGALCVSHLPTSDRVISYHLITEGSCQARLARDPTSTLVIDAGELLVVPRGEPHIMGSDLNLAPVDAAPLLANLAQATPRNILKISHGGNGAATRIICGFLACDQGLIDPLLASLPRIFKINVRGDPRSVWLYSSLEMATVEAAESRAGSSIMLGRLSELLFIEALRRCIDSLPAGQKGWLAGCRDRFVGRALSLLHSKPAHAWTVEELARQSGISRSALAQRFTEFLEQPPMQYLAQWRLKMASHALATGTRPVATVAAQVGYESEAAFNRAFKRQFGKPPAEWRRDRQQAVRSA